MSSVSRWARHWKRDFKDVTFLVRCADATDDESSLLRNVGDGSGRGSDLTREWIAANSGTFGYKDAAGKLHEKLDHEGTEFHVLTMPLQRDVHAGQKRVAPDSAAADDGKRTKGVA